ncbi:MAG: sigma-70 family RNA polymerase sigma factor [Clostridia bacterium]|nr:sigma-70 family RNA polymerase sigma factor [Clostridia bacterium]
MQDHEILELYFARDERAITESSEKYGSYCLGVAQNILHNLQDAEECVNDTWLQAWRSIPPARPAYLQQFLGGITRHISLDRYRYNNRQSVGGGEAAVALDEIQEIVASEESVVTQAEEREMLVSIDRFLWALPERECNIFIRRYYHMDAIKDIAKRYGLTVANVKKILSRTREKLRAFLEKEGYAL